MGSEMCIRDSRDNYPSLEELCKSMCLDETEIRAKLETVGFVYQPERYQFV